MKKIILISLLAIVIFFIGLVLFTPVSADSNNPTIKTTLWQSLTQK